MAPKSILLTMACREDPARRVHAESKTQLKIIIFEIEKKETFRYREEKMTAIDINENKPGTG